MAVIAEGEFYHVLQSDTGSDMWRYTAEEAGRFADFHEQPTNLHGRSLVDATCRAILSEFY
jgi:hypothetical protein